MSKNFRYVMAALLTAGIVISWGLHRYIQSASQENPPVVKAVTIDSNDLTRNDRQQLFALTKESIEQAKGPFVHDCRLICLTSKDELQTCGATAYDLIEYDAGQTDPATVRQLTWYYAGWLGCLRTQEIWADYRATKAIISQTDHVD